MLRRFLFQAVPIDLSTCLTQRAVRTGPYSRYSYAACALIDWECVPGQWLMFILDTLDAPHGLGHASGWCKFIIIDTVRAGDA